jgi:hypothetical protein
MAVAKGKAHVTCSVVLGNLRMSRMRNMILLVDFGYLGKDNSYQNIVIKESDDIRDKHLCQQVT